MFKIVTSLFDSNEKQIKKYRKMVDEINLLENDIKKKSTEELQNRTKEMQKSLKPYVDAIPESQRESIRSTFVDGKKTLSREEQALKDELMKIRYEAFAMVREIARRKMDRRHFDVQLIGGLVFSEGKIAELKTGEGKTQTAHLALFLYGLTGRGAHLVTVNDYLTKRDGEYAGHILSELGLSVGIITSQGAYKFISDEQVKIYKGEEAYEERMSYKIQNPGDVKGANLIEVTKKEAYECDVVYGTNNEFGFDYLRENMATDLDQLVQRELYFCIVDEVDSILIDEARTPLIISTSAEKSNELYVQFARIADKLKEEKDYEVDEKAHSAVLTDEGVEKVEKILGVKNLWEDYQLAHHLENALKAKALYKRDDEYLVRDGQIIIIDSFTGRALPGRRYSEGLHQAIEAKEGVEIQRESKTLATITFQNFFRIYKHLAGATGTAETEAEEFYKIYALDTVVVPTVRPIIRIDHTDRVYKNKQAKFNAVVKEIKERHEKGQPMLVGTTSVENSEILSEMLKKEGIKHQVLNAKYHEKEAQIVAKAGEKGAVTIATNMAGRGTDIKINDEVRELGGLYVIGTERHESRRIDNQLRGRSGRLGDPGESRFFVALDDEIMRIQGGEIVKGIMERTNMDESIPIEAGIIGKTIENAQKKMENNNFDIRKRVVEYDDVMNQQRTIFYDRRRKVLNYAKEVEKQLADATEDGSLTPLEELAHKALEREVINMVDRHFLNERDDEIDIEKLLEDFRDLAQDDLLEKAYSAETEEGASLNDLKDSNLLQEEITDLLVRTANKAIDIKREEVGRLEFSTLIKNVFLQTMDQDWTDHLEAMQDLREGIGLRGYAQRDPLVEYKNEGFALFERFLDKIDEDFAHRILKVVTIDEDKLAQMQMLTNQDKVEDILTGSRDAFGMLQKAVHSVIESQQTEQDKQAQELGTNKESRQKTVKNDKKIGRNDPCPCGSGKKYKHCHGKNK